MKFNIVNHTANKIVLRDCEAQDASHAVGKYISAMFIAGICKDCDKDFKWLSDTAFTIPSKGWNMEVVTA